MARRSRRALSRSPGRAVSNAAARPSLTRGARRSTSDPIASPPLHAVPAKELLPRTASHGFFPEGSPLDRFDKRFSRAILFWDAHWLLDYLLLLPGTWFGLPAACWGLLPLVWFWVDEHGPGDQSHRSLTYFALLVAVPALAYAAMFARAVLAGDLHGIYSPRGQLPLPAVVWALAPVISTRAGYGPAALFAVSWTLGQFLCHMLKFTGGRLRPIAHFDLSSVRREFKELRYLFATGQTALESFPSADATGAGSFTASLWFYGFPWYVCGVPGLASTFARVYFHAHHVGDVSIGFTIGFLGHAALFYAFGDRSLGAPHVFAAAAAFIASHVASKRFKPKLPDHLVSSDEGRYKDF